MSNKNEKRNPTWEILAVVVGFVATARDFTWLIHYLFTGSSDGLSYLWFILYILMYMAILISLSSLLLFYVKVSETHNEKEIDTQTEAALFFKKILRRARIRSYFITLGFYFFVELIRKRYGIFFYDYFDRPSEWGPSETCFDFINRFHPKDTTIEIQYAKDYSALYVRRTFDTSGKFGEFNKIIWCEFEYKWLTITKFRTCWWTIRHLFDRIFNKHS